MNWIKQVTIRQGICKTLAAALFAMLVVSCGQAAEPAALWYRQPAHQSLWSRTRHAE